jgi:hypothetical protein
MKIHEGKSILTRIVSLGDGTASEESYDELVHDGYPIENEYTEGGFNFVVMNGTVTITRYRNIPTEQHIVVPGEIVGLPVRALGDKAFHNHRYMVTIKLPDGLESIGRSAFYRCYSLEAMHIPSSVTSIDGNPFFRSSALATITVDSANRTYSSIDGVLFEKGHATMLCYPEARPQEAYEIPRSVERLASDVFGYHCRHLRELVIPSSVVQIEGGGVFAYWADVTLVVEPYSVAEEYAQRYGFQYRLVDVAMYD